ncbi:glycosyltransferase family 2 protein [uncultured Rikenella sp.]|uniref:glycosyltransferase family 2 protein n=3 Tax=uncultured Rikenella sp. TaxID=368003 RepID=UPI00261777B5|nr:glycosyltransferase family 2 protein [uncultured Rikenella sp.]
MTSFKVSVIVPCYNAEQFLTRCLDSLVNQTLEGIEIICVNDASPDNGIAILRDYEARYPNVVVIDLKENVRQGGARNRGIEIARGEYIGFVDADDWVDLRMFEKLYNKAKETKVEVVSCGLDYIDSTNTISGANIKTNLLVNGIIHEEQRELLLIGMQNFAAGNLIRKSLLFQHSIRFPEQIFYEDNYFNVVVGLYANGYTYVFECLYHIYINPDSTTRRRNTTHVSQRITVLKMILNHFQQQGYSKKYHKFLNYYTALTLYLCAFEYLDRQDMPSYHFIQKIHLYLHSYRIDRCNPYLLKHFGYRGTLAVWLLRHLPKIFWHSWILSNRLHLNTWPLMHLSRKNQKS